ncbi:MAG: 3-oxoacyl-ACP reductase [Planctomycetes bacterium RBG_16_59_8]|nr:MAG: 3-oxoacyl-ACP reductase [Planctomycetes bacterium RBG_16_59_8]
MDLGIKGKTAIVCASSKGMGRASAFQFAREGANIVLCARTGKRLQETAEEIRKETGVDVLAIPADVTKAEDRAKIIGETVSRFGTVHILVNNSGGPPPGSFADFQADEWAKAVEANLLSAIEWCRGVIPFMKQQRWGRIVNIASISVKQPIDGLILSNTARAGLIGFAKTISRELASHNILVNNVCPGTILTDRIMDLARSRAAMADVTVSDILKHMEEEIPVKRIGRPEEAANLVVFLASEAAAYITGTTILVDGGLYRGIM